MLETGLVILSIGVRPESQLAKDAGIELGPRGHIRVDAWQRTSAPHVYAVGDVCESPDPLLGGHVAIALGGPANRQGRTAADHIFLGEKALPFRGSIGTSIVRLVRREGPVLTVRGLDCLNGTPLLDIKPYRCSYAVQARAKPGVET